MKKNDYVKLNDGTVGLVAEVFGEMASVVVGGSRHWYRISELKVVEEAKGGIVDSSQALV